MTSRDKGILPKNCEIDKISLITYGEKRIKSRKRIGFWGNIMPANLVNLDALIPREDFEVNSDNPPQTSMKVEKFSIQDFEPGKIQYLIIRKPDFQRETASWSPERVADLIRSFLDGDLLPSIIVWRSPHTGNIFVIDGAHRLGSLIAWVYDDYGDGPISRNFYENCIPPEQAVAAEKTRAIVNNTIGTYGEMVHAVRNPQHSDADKVMRAKNLAVYGIPVQWIDGDATKAETSFFKINQQAAPIDPTELRLLKARNSPAALAARAIIRAGTGHKYWGKFTKEITDEIIRLSKDINDYLFIPPLSTPIKTLNLPIAGHVYSSEALPLLYDLVNISNEIRYEKKKRDGVDISGYPATVDADGTQTLNYLRNTKKVVARISSPLASSLGLHPAVYFYSALGRHQPTSVLAVASFMLKMEKENGFCEFVKYRKPFEDFLLNYKEFVNQIVIKSGSKIRHRRVERMLSFVLNLIKKRDSESTILNKLIADSEFSFLKIITDQAKQKQKDFSTATKSGAFLKAALENPIRCRICGCLIHKNTITFDHIEGKKDGGVGTVENAQLAHPFCNSTVKN